MRNPAATAITLLLAAACTACGGEKPAASSAAAPARAGAIPEDLTGTWEARISDDELAVAPDGLPDGPSRWTLKFLDTGGENNGPAVFLSNDRAGELAGPISVSTDEISLESEATCNEYRFEVRDRAGGRTLHLRPDDDRDGCPSTAIGSVLSARGWSRPGGPASAKRGGRSAIRRPRAARAPRRPRSAP